MGAWGWPWKCLWITSQTTKFFKLEDWKRECGAKIESKNGRHFEELCDKMSNLSLPSYFTESSTERTHNMGHAKAVAKKPSSRPHKRSGEGSSVEIHNTGKNHQYRASTVSLVTCRLIFENGRRRADQNGRVRERERGVGGVAFSCSRHISNWVIFGGMYGYPKCYNEEDQLTNGNWCDLICSICIL